MNNKDLVILAENQVHNIHKDHKNPFELAMSSIWVLNATGEMTCRKLYGDVYDLLDSPETLAAIKGEEFFGVLTSGWAAPIEECNEDTPPSKAKERRRVRLFVSATDDGAISVLRFKDNPDETVIDEGTAKGSLADAVLDLYTKKQMVESLEEMMKGMGDTQ
ncbi:MAG: hypothetical protein EB035_05430 [Actinobacteria bacterium]|nr:hypothetical protein [Acidimicrobiia bacterium]NDB42400.1 hypothetical protein [Actinomycetota bacterium]